MMIEVFGGTGFVGTEFCKRHSSECRAAPRETLEVPKNSKVLYLISTVDNYNVLTDPYVDINTNLIHLMKVLDANKSNNIEFHFVSSWFVYGEVALPAREDSCCRPNGFYSITKLAAEQLLESYCRTYKIKYTITRLGNVVGRGDGKASKKKNALQYLVDEMKANRDIVLYDAGMFYRDFVHVSDVADGLKFIVENGADGEVYNLGSATEEPTLFKDVVEYAYRALNSTSRVGTMSATEFHSIVQVKNMHLDCSKLKSLGWKPSRTVLQAIKEIL